MAKSNKAVINKSPLVSSVTARIKHMVYEGSTNEVATPEETVARKKLYLGILDKAMAKIEENLDNGKMTLETSADLDRVIKLSLLVSGEANAIVGKSGTESVNETDIEARQLSIDKLERILDLNDPEVQAVYNKLYENYNIVNDESEDE